MPRTTIGAMGGDSIPLAVTDVILIARETALPRRPIIGRAIDRLLAYPARETVGFPSFQLQERAPR